MQPCFQIYSTGKDNMKSFHSDVWVPYVVRSPRPGAASSLLPANGAGSSAAGGRPTYLPLGSTAVPGATGDGAYEFECRILFKTGVRMGDRVTAKKAAALAVVRELYEQGALDGNFKPTVR